MPDGNYTYVPNPNFHGTDSFTYRAFDGYLYSETGAITIDVTPVNDTPVANNDTITVDQDVSTFLPLLVNDTDVDSGSILSLSGFTNPNNGTVTPTATGVVYTPNPGFTGSDSMTYTISDELGLESSPAIVNIIVSVVNVPPVAHTGSYIIDEDNVLTGVVTAYDYNGDTLTYTVETSPTLGALNFHSSGSFSYVPNPNVS